LIKLPHYITSLDFDEGENMNSVKVVYKIHKANFAIYSSQKDYTYYGFKSNKGT